MIRISYFGKFKQFLDLVMFLFFIFSLLNKLAYLEIS